MLKRIHFATPVRGFFKHLMNDTEVNAEFTSVEGALYEINGQKNLRTLLKSIARSTVGDFMGFIHTPSAMNHPCDLYASSNRFLKADKPYFIYVENPNIKVDWTQYAGHAAERMQQRGITQEMVNNVIKNGKVLLQNNGNKFAYITQEGGAIVSKEGKLITAWSSADFDSSILEIINQLFEK